MGKGSKERIVPFGSNTRTWLRTYLKRRGDQPVDLLFVTEYGEQVTVYHLDHRLKIYAKKADITGVKVSSHQFRRVFAVNFLRNGGDLFSLQKLLGHTSLEMVRRYANLNDDDVKRAHKLYSPLDRMVDSGKVTAKAAKSELKPRRKRIR
jgi:integrase/recombinase XerD